MFFRSLKSRSIGTAPGTNRVIFPTVNSESHYADIAVSRINTRNLL
ncbi:hypothetical protein RRSWK_06022 [Rhodopirellula sp. SWK7]|nr:hypothetical protein RRSWK_06022 [Rhodopirellula sp. SWK7]